MNHNNLNNIILQSAITCILFIFIFISGCRTSNSDNNKNIVEAWRKTGPGGGGAMFNPAVSPHDPEYAFVACDMTGSYVTYNGGDSWKMFSLHAPVSYFVFDPQDSDVVYANSIGLLRSNDQGNTWNLIYPDPEKIKGVVSRGDHAEEIIITNDSTGYNVIALAVDPENSLKLHAVISKNNIETYYFSDDRGKTWTSNKDLGKGTRNIYINPSSPLDNRTLYFTGKNSITVREKGIWHIYPGPVNVSLLTEFSGGFDKKLNKYIIYSISGKSYFNPAGDPSGIYYTENGGKSWENRQSGLVKMCSDSSELPEWRTVATCVSHPEVVYISYNGLKVDKDTSCLGVAKSEDYGKTWRLVWKDCLIKGGDLFSVNYNKGWIDERFGPGWGENPFSIGVSPVNPDICYTTDFGRTIKTSDGGTTWDQVYTRKKEGNGWISRGLEVTTGYNIVSDPFDINHLFIANTDIGLMESTDAGESWTSATDDNGIPNMWINSTYWLTFDPEVKGKIWAVMSGIHDLPRPKMWRRRDISGYNGGIVVSIDGGKTWKPVSSDIGEAAMTHILLDPASDKGKRTLYACAFGKGVYKSVDGGMTWIQKNNGIYGKEPFAWRIFRNDINGELFLVVCRRSDDGSIGTEYDGAVYRSSDGAESWSKMQLPDGTNGPMSIIPDPEKSGRLLLSAWGRITSSRFSSDTGGGIFLSSDNGKTWKQTLGKDQHIHDITYDNHTHTYYACGFNGSAYRSEDRGDTWIRIKGYNFKWGKRVEPDPADPKKIYIITFGGGVWHGPARGDENAVEDIVTPFLNR